MTICKGGVVGSDVERLFHPTPEPGNNLEMQRCGSVLDRITSQWKMDVSAATIGSKAVQLIKDLTNPSLIEHTHRGRLGHLGRNGDEMLALGYHILLVTEPLHRIAL